MTSARAADQPGSSCACRYCAAPVRSTTPRAARAPANARTARRAASSRGRRRRRRPAVPGSLAVAHRPAPVRGVVVDDRHVQARRAGGVGLGGEVLVGTAGAQRVTRNQATSSGHGAIEIACRDRRAVDTVLDDRAGVHDRRGRFLAAAGDHLAADPVMNTVVIANAHRPRTWPNGGPPRHFWWLVVRDGSGAVVGAGMRTAPDPPHPLFLLPMPETRPSRLARTLHGRGEETLAVDGALPAAGGAPPSWPGSPAAGPRQDPHPAARARRDHPARAGAGPPRGRDRGRRRPGRAVGRRVPGRRRRAGRPRARHRRARHARPCGAAAPHR